MGATIRRLFVVLTVATFAAAGTSLAGAATPGPDAPLTIRAKAAKVPLMSGEAFATHTHTQLQTIVDDKPLKIPADIGIDETARQITAVHTHDQSGILHVESPKKSDHYRLDQFFTLWGMGNTKAELCQSLAAAATCTMKISSSKAPGRGLRTRLDDHDNILVEITTGG